MSEWVNYAAIAKILGFGLLAGAALPGLFAVGMRMHGAGTGGLGGADGAIATRRPTLIALSWLIFLLVLIAVILSVLFIARDFIAAQTGWHILGARTAS